MVEPSPDVTRPEVNGPGSKSPGILVVDDEAGDRASIGDVLAEAGLACVVAESGVQAVEAATHAAVGVVLLDIGMADERGGSLQKRLLELRPSLRVIALAGVDDADRVLDALRAGACDYLAKPLHGEELVLAVERALETYTVTSQWTRLRGRQGRLVARMEELAARVVGLRGEERLAMARVGIARAASDVLEAEKTSLMWLDPDGIVLRVAACVGRSMKPEELDAVEVGHGVAGSVFERREAWAVADAASDSRVAGVDREGRYATSSFAVVPVVAGDIPVGVLCATDRMAGDDFGEDDLALLRILALQASELLALAAAPPTQYEASVDDEALSAGEAEVADHQPGAPAAADRDDAPPDRDAELAREICQAATDEVEPERVIRGVLRPLAALLPAAPVSIFLIDSEDGELRKEGECDGGVAADRALLSWGRGLTGTVLQTGQLVATPSPASDPRFDAEIDTPEGGEVRPFLCVPLKLRGKVIGVCRAFLRDPAEASPRTAEVISAVLSAAVRNALLYRSLVEAIEDVADARRAARG